MTDTSSLSSNQNSDQIPTYTKSPEFPFAVPVMLIGIVSVIAFYRIKFRK
jgi:hypothetical protein